MKKILSGILFRFFRSIETWGLFILLILATLYLGKVEYEYTANEDIFTPSAVRFEDTDVNAKEVYMYDCEAISERSYKLLDEENNLASSEVELLNMILNDIPVLPIILMALYVPLFFGRLFSDGTIKNLLASGHSKGKIYFASLMFSLIIELGLFLISTGIYALWGVVHKWHPPIYLPPLLLLFLANLLFAFTITSFCMASLFLSGKKTVAFVVSFILSALVFISPIAIPSLALSMTQTIDAEGEDIKKLQKAKEEAPYAVGEHVNLAEYTVEFSYKGERFSFIQDSTLPKPVKNIMLVFIYSDPGLIMHIRTTTFAFPFYCLYRDGIMAINIGNNVFWLIFANCLGFAVFRKKEIR